MAEPASAGAIVAEGSLEALLARPLPTLLLEVWGDDCSACIPWLESRPEVLEIVPHAGFLRLRLRPGTARIRLLLDGVDANSAQIILGPPGSGLEVRSWFNPDLDDRWYFIPGIMANVVLIATLILTAMSVVRERELGTLERDLFLKGSGLFDQGFEFTMMLLLGTGSMLLSTWRVR